MIVVFEGIDACGKETQVRMLQEYAEDKGIETLRIDFPDYETDTGRAIYEMLKMKNTQRDPLVLQSIMTINRYEVQSKIESAQALGKLVILDRYWMSGWVYGQTDGLNTGWLEEVHTRLIQPHQWFILDITTEESFRRRPEREDAYEADRKRLQAARVLYMRASEQPCFELCKVLDGRQYKQEVHKDIVRVLDL